MKNRLLNISVNNILIIKNKSSFIKTNEMLED